MNSPVTSRTPSLVSLEANEASQLSQENGAFYRGGLYPLAANSFVASRSAQFNMPIVLSPASLRASNSV